jgi:hypothetical protein
MVLFSYGVPAKRFMEDSMLYNIGDKAPPRMEPTTLGGFFVPNELTILHWIFIAALLIEGFQYLSFKIRRK